MSAQMIDPLSGALYALKAVTTPVVRSIRLSPIAAPPGWRRRERTRQATFISCAPTHARAASPRSNPRRTPGRVKPRIRASAG